jgi:D-beta-D-heptose 7-phosphate kinase/D-beta-D-heptose 1-phosphate adenosyltransferase
MINIQELTPALMKFIGTPILVVGDLMIDEYLWGHIERISLEAPVQVVDIVKEECMLGGSGNVVKNLVSLGAKVYISSVIDEKETGKLILSELKRLGVAIDGLFKDKNKISSKKTRVLSFDKYQQILRIDRETNYPISQKNEKNILNYIKSNIESFKVVILSDYMKGVLTDNLLKDIIDFMNASKIPVIIDPKGKDFTKYRNATLITPNKKEVETVLDMKITDEAALRIAGKKLLSKLNVEAILITLGKDGMSLFEKDNLITHIPAEEKEVYDITGAGDTVISVVGLGLASGLAIKKAIEIANLAAGITVGKIGTATVTIQEIISYTFQRNIFFNNKILNLPALTAIVEEERKNGSRIVFTNGCFDILHAGHTYLLQRAKMLGDVLIVGLNSDKSVKRLKGNNRPIIPIKERAAILSSLTYVNYIIVFEEDTPIELIKNIKPDILVKGNDYTIEDVIGRDIVESYGGRVELIKLIEGVSTSSIIDRIMKTNNIKRQKRN